LKDKTPSRCERYKRYNPATREEKAFVRLFQKSEREEKDFAKLNGVPENRKIFGEISKAEREDKIFVKLNGVPENRKIFGGISKVVEKGITTP